MRMRSKTTAISPFFHLEVIGIQPIQNFLLHLRVCGVVKLLVTSTVTSQRIKEILI
jgi:hypothetical protein